MKKLLALLLVLLLAFVFVGCGKSEKKDTVSKKDDTSAVSKKEEVSEPVESKIPAEDIDEEPEELADEKKLELKNDGDWVIVAKTAKSIKLASAEEMKNYKLGYLFDTDGERYAVYYCDEDTAGGYGTSHDLHSGLLGDIDLAIMERSVAVQYTDLEIVWDFAAQQ